MKEWERKAFENVRYGMTKEKAEQAFKDALERTVEDAQGKPLDLEVLKAWGFAPGAYHGFCSDCGKTHTADKRAWRCLDCAEAKVNLTGPMVAAAYEDVASWQEVEGYLLDELDQIPDAIRRRTPDYARAALDAVKSEAEREGYKRGLREAADREAHLLRVLDPFSKMAGELFARNYDAPDIVLSFETPEGETVSLDFADFLCVRDAILAIAEAAEKDTPND